MHNLSLIACVSQDYGLGHNGNLLWRIPEDMQFFRKTTLDSTVVMGRKTYESIGRPLPQRENIVLSRGSLDGVKTFHNENELTKYLEATDNQKFIIGGATLYNMFINQAAKIYLTEVDAMKPSDTFFPAFDKSEFSRKVLQTGEQDNVKYEIVEYTRE